MEILLIDIMDPLNCFLMKIIEKFTRYINLLPLGFAIYSSDKLQLFHTYVTTSSFQRNYCECKDIDIQLL